MRLSDYMQAERWDVTDPPALHVPGNPEDWDHLPEEARSYRSERAQLIRHHMPPTDLADEQELFDVAGL